jgi:hypothetical protein
MTGPSSVQFETTIQIVDTSFVTGAIHDTILVPEANVVLYSTSYGITYEGLSNSAGEAVLSDMVPDIYNASVFKIYPSDTVEKYLPLQQDITLVGSKSNISLSSGSGIIQIELHPVFSSELLISEIFYNGSPQPPPYYFHDQFTEIYNNSSETIYLDSYAICDAAYGYKEDLQYIHSIHLYSFPGSGQDYPLEPGEMITIAQDAIDHTEINSNSLNLSQSTFEYYNHLSSDIDNPLVPNMVQIHHKYGIDFLYSVANDAILLVKLEESDTLWNYDDFDQILVPRDRVVDGVEYRENTLEYDHKRLTDDIDAGITGGLPMYQGKSIARKVFQEQDSQLLLMDNNNSSIDFQVLDTPTPGIINE